MRAGRRPSHDRRPVRAKVMHQRPLGALLNDLAPDQALGLLARALLGSGAGASSPAAHRAAHAASSLAASGAN